MGRGNITAAAAVAAGVWRIAAQRNLDLIAAGVAFYAMLAVFPAIASVIAIWGFVADPALVGAQLDALRPFMPQDAFSLVAAQAEAVIATNSSVLGWASALSLLAALWSTRAAVGALVRGLNAVYGTRPRSGFWHSIAAVVLTLVLLAMALMVIVAVIVLPVLLVLLPLGPATAGALTGARWALILLPGLAGLWILYRYGPNHRPARSPWMSPGAVLAMLLWVAASYGFTVYLTSFGSFNQIYGSIGAVMVLLMWLYLSAYAVLLGAALNAVMGRN